MGNSMSSDQVCVVCSTIDSARPSLTPCCGEVYHLDCLQTHLGTRNTTCLKCHQVFPANILELHPATAIGGLQQQIPTLTAVPLPPNTTTVIPHAQLIPNAPQPPSPFGYSQSQPSQNPFISQSQPSQNPLISQRQPRQNPFPFISQGQLSELDKVMMLEETVSPWVPPPASQTEVNREVQVLIECSPEVPQVSLLETKNFNSVISFSASSQSSQSASTEDSLSLSPPMDIICILDVSGSMSSDNKLTNLKSAVNFMREELKEDDRMSVITFESFFLRIHGLLKMTPENKSRTQVHVNQLAPGGGTKILAGLQEAHNVLQSRQTRNPITSVFLLTDGCDPSDLRDKKRIAKEIKDMGASLFVYGFGNDHDSVHLKAIADAGEGTFTFIEKSDMVIDAFGGALGAEKSIFAQRLSLTLMASNGSTIRNVHAGNYRKTIDPSGSSATVYFHNMMVGEQRDILVAMDLPPSQSPEESFSTLTTRLEYESILPTDPASRQVTIAGPDCIVSRRIKVDAGLERNSDVDVQINRVKVDVATVASLALADQGKYEEARNCLAEALGEIKQSATVLKQDVRSVTFVTEIEGTISSLKDSNAYRSEGGRSMLSEMQQNVNHQRCTYSKGGRSDAFQISSSKSAQAKMSSKKSSNY